MDIIKNCFVQFIRNSLSSINILKSRSLILVVDSENDFLALFLAASFQTGIVSIKFLRAIFNLRRDYLRCVRNTNRVCW